MKIKAPFRIIQRIPPYRKARPWTKRLRMEIRSSRGRLLMLAMWHNIGWRTHKTIWKLIWSGGNGHYKDHTKEAV